MTETNTMANLLSQLGTVVTQMLAWSSDVASTVVSTPLYLVVFGVFMMGAAIGIFKRIFGN